MSLSPKNLRKKEDRYVKLRLWIWTKILTYYILVLKGEDHKCLQD